MANFKKIIFPNVYEVVKRSIDCCNLTPFQQEELKSNGKSYSELGLLWEGDNKLVIVPEEIEDVQTQYIKYLLGYKNISVIKIRDNNGVICNLTDEIDSLTNNIKYLKGFFWGASEEAYTLINNFNENGTKLETSDIPHVDNFDIAKKLDSKVEFKQLLRDSRIAVTTMDSNCVGTYNAFLSEANKCFQQMRPTMIKSEFGVGGYGNILLNERTLKYGVNRFTSCMNRLQNSRSFFRGERYIFEELALEKDYCLEPLSCMAKIEENGQCVINGVVKENRILGKYYGAETLIESKKEISHATLEIGRFISKLNYRGYFCADYLKKHNGDLTLLELNTRRCASHFVFDIAENLCSNGFIAKNNLSLPIVSINKNNQNIFKVIEIIDKINNHNEGFVIPTQLNGLNKDKPYIGFLIIADNSVTVDQIFKEFVKKLSNIGIVLRG
jgi:hypothetical protein